MDLRTNDIDILFLDGFFSGFELTSFMGYIYPIGPVLKSSGYSYKLLHLQLLKEYTIDSLINELNGLNLGALGISTHADNVKFVYELVNEIKVHFPNLPIILGGAQASFNDEKIMSLCKADVIIRNEGEIKLVRVLDYFIRNVGRLEAIDGITYRNDKCVIANKDGDVIDINSIPTFDYSILNDKQYWHIPKHISPNEFDSFLSSINVTNNVYVGSRGCPYKCIFCVEGNLNQKHRMRSPENIYKDLESLLSNTKSKFIVFGDDTFTATKKRIIEMCTILTKLRRKYNFYWFAEGRVNVLAKHPELIRHMAETGMVMLQVGIESGSQKVLDAQNKQITTGELEKVFEEVGLMQDVDIRIVGNLILGCPEETIETLQETLEFTKKLHKLAHFNSQIIYSYLVPFKGTPIGDNPAKYKLKVIEDEFELNMQQFREIICYSEHLSYYELDRMHSTYNRDLMSFYNEAIFKLDKKAVDNRMLRDRYLYKYGITQNMNAWLFTIYSYTFIVLYYNLFERKYILKSSVVSDVNVYPIALWELDYDINKNQYTFEALSGDEIVIQGDEIYLWQMANGSNTIIDILLCEKSPYREQEQDVALSAVLEFYNRLYESFALVYSEI